MAKIEGGCLCGAVRYRASAEPLMTVVCQCTHCQKLSGSPYSVMLALPKGSLEFTGDAPATYVDTGTSGMPVHRRFCGKCGSPLDDASWVHPQAAIWCDSAQPWAPLPEGVSQVAQNPAFG
jgi:hypothetical protein